MRLTHCLQQVHHFRLVVVGGGAAGCAVSHLFAPRLGQGKVAVIEPNKDHYYQPGFTFAGAGIVQLDSLRRDEKSLLNGKATWIRDQVKQFQPKNNSLTIGNGDELKYDFLVIAAGLQLRFDMIKGLPDAFSTDGICSIYSPDYVQSTFRAFETFTGGNAIFTFPNTPIKCAGAPQKICYLFDDYLRKKNQRQSAQIMYNTALGKIFGVEKYAAALMEVVRDRGIQLNVRHNLIGVDSKKKLATFEMLNENSAPTGEERQIEYSLLHIGAPCSPVPVLRNCPDLCDAKGWVDVHPETLQSTRFSNIFALGDCANTPNAKTAAAVASQLRSLKYNLNAAIAGQSVTAKYDGYASCPLIVSTKHVILAEFNSKGPMETFPVNQAKPRRFSWWLKRYLMQPLYWHGLVRGRWLGPATIRKWLHFGSK